MLFVAVRPLAHIRFVEVLVSSQLIGPIINPHAEGLLRGLWRRLHQLFYLMFNLYRLCPPGLLGLKANVLDFFVALVKAFIHAIELV